ncbi:non-hydrolyzing UDP-N-acetylglucosamine 2-epimerase [Melghirimyces algeriensis]|uniref:UDP-N-acetylglucosamine 2-epimerase (Non-hydrolysing)/UDP-GlcNAc3NAcA epimerase n=1 Tax=Melghirimyces algeriensis TaxID=910412 RepID=A0A521D4M2_9BACL|nr:UDP-N-acetylglucosamine 2-epimerase (non-hydrolyzing) [Melghirimyces algeriensis]SMO66666.1 UDP-N-acetylglucosamine 2-epimerase (non-hydrolysing)/UDP-GlcNAc3NAcA epimerase [Melghirimyces algeriensis]
MKVVTVVGARPQFIKAAPVSRALRRYGKEILVHTGQHYDTSMSHIFFKELNIPHPDYHLGIGSKSHGAQTGEMLSEVERVLLTEKPDWVLVYGDTNSTLAGALAASKMHLPIAHVEAGLRSFNRRMPEEINRVLTDQLSTLLFCPTTTAVQHLSSEGITRGVYNVGDVMADALQFNRKLALDHSNILERLEIKPKEYLLVTFHRAENTDVDHRLENIVSALNHLSKPAVLPLHPRTRNKIKQSGLSFTNPRLKVIEPVGYLDMIQLEANASKILTDSGGVQKEAFLLNVPCITMRDETEWTETIEQKANILVGSDKRKIVQHAEHFQVDFSNVKPIFGEGNASQRIVKHLIKPQ